MWFFNTDFIHCTMFHGTTVAMGVNKIISIHTVLTGLVYWTAISFSETGYCLVYVCSGWSERWKWHRFIRFYAVAVQSHAGSTWTGLIFVHVIATISHTVTCLHIPPFISCLCKVTVWWIYQTSWGREIKCEASQAYFYLNFCNELYKFINAGAWKLDPIFT